MDWRRKRQIRNLVDGILELNTLHRPPIELIPAIMKQRGIVFEERDEDDEEFCGVYMVVKQAKIIFVNANLRTSRKHFTIAHVEEFVNSINSGYNQIIFTAHDVNLINLDRFRQDEIWFIEKNYRGESRLKPLSNFEINEKRDALKAYLSGRFGAIPTIRGRK